MHKPIYIVGGGKGGVGKSMTSMALVDYFLNQSEEKILLLETDTSNPDVLPCFAKTPDIIGKLADLDQEEGWMLLANLCEQHSDHIAVVNTAARNSVGVAEHGGILRMALEELKREIIVLWLINTDRDSLQLLTKFMSDMPGCTIHVLRNLKHGLETHFNLYNASNLKKTIEAAGGTSQNFPKLALDVAQSLFSDRLSIKTAMTQMPIGNRAALSAWRQKCSTLFENIVSHGTEPVEAE